MQIPPQQALVQLMLQLQRNGPALSQAYAARQTALELEKVVTVERLSSMEGVDTSLAVVDALETLVAEHRVLVQQWLVEAMRQLVPVLEAHPEDQRKDISDGLTWNARCLPTRPISTKPGARASAWMPRRRPSSDCRKRLRPGCVPGSGSWAKLN